MAAIGIVGNIALDYYLLNYNDTQRVKEKLATWGIELEAGKKITDDKVNGLLAKLEQATMRKLGGGGYNSLKAFLEISRNNDFLYYDISQKPPKIERLREDKRVTYNFRNLSYICQGLIIRKGNDRTIIKTPRYDRGINVKREDLESLANGLTNSDVIFVNSIGNYYVADTIGRNFSDKPKYVVVTKTLIENELKPSKLLVNSLSIIDVDEIDILGYPITKTNGSSIFENENNKRSIKNAIEKLLKLGAKKAIVTLGQEGVVYSENGSIKRVSTKREKEAEIQDSMATYNILKNGTGDYFASGLVFYLENMPDFEEAITNAQIFVIKNMLKYQDITERDFETTIIR